MKRSNLIRTVKMDCPICDKVHNVEERKRLTQINIKGDVVEYEEVYYSCSEYEEENEFVTGKLSNMNLLCARNAYRKKHKLLTSDEIVDIRKLYNLSQVELSKLMGWGEATISRYESKAIQDETYDNLLKFVRDNPLKALELLDNNKDNFTTDRYNELRNIIIEKHNEYGKEYLSRQALKGEYVSFSNKSDSNGNTLLDIDKLECVISYYAEKIGDLYKVKLMKLLWYTDVLAYKLRGHAITGLVYKHDSMGALPIGHYKIVELENVKIKEERIPKYEDNVCFKFCKNSNLSIEYLESDEINILDVVINKFKDYSGTELKDYMHEESAYIKTEKNDIIPFSLAEDIRDFNN